MGNKSRLDIEGKELRYGDFVRYNSGTFASNDFSGNIAAFTKDGRAWTSHKEGYKTVWQLIPCEKLKKLSK